MNANTSTSSQKTFQTVSELPTLNQKDFPVPPEAAHILYNTKLQKVEFEWLLAAVVEYAVRDKTWRSVTFKEITNHIERIGLMIFKNQIAKSALELVEQNLVQIIQFNEDCYLVPTPQFVNYYFN